MIVYKYFITGRKYYGNDCVWNACVIQNKIKKPTTYEFYVKDLNTNEDICVRTGLTKATMKEMKKSRGLKKVSITELKN